MNRAASDAHAWRVVGCAFLIATWSWGLGFYGLGVYLVGLQDTRGWSSSLVSGAITGYYLIGAALIALAARAFERFGPVITVCGGAAAMATAVSALSVVTAPWQAYGVFALLAVGWAAMSGAAINIIVAPWFQRRRGMALSLAFTGASMGGVLIGPAMLAVVGGLGFAPGLRVSAVAMLATVVPAAVLILRRPAPVAPRAATASAEHAGLRSRAYWTISVAFAAGLTAQVGFITHQLAILTPTLGLAGAGACVSVTALAAIVGRFVLGPLADRGDPRLAACANFVVQLCGVALVAWQPDPAALYTGCGIFGLGVGNMVSLPGLIVQREFAAARFAALVSALTATNQVTFAFAPTLMALLRDATGGYDAALAMVAGLDVVGASVVLLGRRRSGAANDTPEEGRSVLQIRPNCECCDRDLAPDSRDAFICSFECTFCRACADDTLRYVCPNCGGELVRRPARPIDKLVKYPPSSKRIVKPDGCARIATPA